MQAPTSKAITKMQRDSLRRALVAHPSWIRASYAGERVTLASLYYRGLMERRAWRGVEGEAGAAYEYRVGPGLRDAIARKRQTADAR